MPVTVFVDAKNNIVKRIVNGLVSSQELTDSISYSINHPDFRPGMLSLTDLRKAKHNMNSEDIRNIAWFVKSSLEEVRGVKAAVIVSQEVSYGMMHMLQNYLINSPLNIGLFYDMEKAVNWLNEDS